jgi:protein SMG5
MKKIDEKRSKCTTISSLFTEDQVDLRAKIIELIEQILLEDFEQISKKTREILWRKVYYDPISTSKKFLKKAGGELNSEDSILLHDFIRDAIRHYKTLILRFEDIFNLDLRYVIDFGIIANGAGPFEKRTEKEIYTASEINHALETIHCFLISLGDLHRYCIDFKFDEKDFKCLAANYYYEAFKLNPKNGMPHNQLGTLAGGENFEIESIFHYLYSLCSPQPADLSEANVQRIFQHNIESLEQQCGGDFSVKEFMQQIILVIDIFFYDKEIAEFNTLCYSALLSFKEYLVKCRRNSQQDLTFQLTSIFMLCLLKLKMNNSPKIHSLNAFLIAFCAEIVNRTIEKLDEYIADRKNEDLAFIEEYNKNFHDFEKKVRRARDLNSRIKTSNIKEKDSGVEKNGSGSSNSLKEGHMSLSDPHSLSQPGQVKIVKRPPPEQPQKVVPEKLNRRRRKRRGISASTSSDESESESLFSDNISMNSDFDSFDEDEDYLGMKFSSDDSDSEDGNESDGADFIIENEEIVYKDDDEMSSNEDFLIEEETIVFKEHDEETMKLLKMKYKKKYTKVDPNLILQFCDKYSSWMQSLKVLFDWLHLNTDILLDCYRSNPEFVTKVMKLINFINIDIFTRKIYFDRSLISVKNVRENLRSLFDSRHQIATSEDVVFKKFSLFEELQQPIDWNLNYKLQITAEEDVALRTFKLIDFGFYLCKQKKFNYNFCARSRIFIEKQPRRRERNREGREKNGEKRRRNRNRNRNRDRKQKVSECEQFERLSIKTHSQESQHEEFPSLQASARKVKFIFFIKF